MQTSAVANPSKGSRQFGLVAFLDILGYQNFVLNNDVEDGVQPILQALAGMPESVKGELLGKAPESVAQILKETQHLVFSDTILLTCPVGTDLTDAEKLSRWAIFTLQVGLLQRKLFHFGFPIRGVITCGNFIWEESCFAGRAIIEAYQQVGEVDAAAVVFAPATANEMARFLETERSESKPFLSHLVVDYLVPTKTQQPRRFWTVNFARFVSPDLPSLVGDARDLVADCFWKHNKDLPQAAYSKLTNTELLLRFLRPKV